MYLKRLALEAVRSFGRSELDMILTQYRAVDTNIMCALRIILLHRNCVMLLPLRDGAL